MVPASENTLFNFFFYIYNLHFFKQKVYSHQLLIYLNVPGIPFKKPLQNSVKSLLNIDQNHTSVFSIYRTI